MSIKKLLILSAAGFAAVSSAVAFAGGPDAMGPPAAQSAPCPTDTASMFQPAFYVDADGGYAFQTQRQSDSTHNVFNSYTDNKNGGVVGALDVGAQLFNNIGVELGGVYLPKITGLQNTAESGSASVAGASANQYNWVAYAAAKFGTPVPYVDGLSLYAKVGPGWRGIDNDDFTNSSYKGFHNYWTVVYGAGLGYKIMQTGFTANAEWLHIGANTDNKASPTSKQVAEFAPASNLLMAGLGYELPL